MKILCVVAIEALIDGRGMDGMGAGCGVKGCAGYDGGRAVNAGNQKFLGLLISIRQVLFSSGWLTICFRSHKGLLVCAWRANCLLCLLLRLAWGWKNMPQHLDCLER